MRNGCFEGLGFGVAACFLGEAELFVSDTFDFLCSAKLHPPDRNHPGQVDLETLKLERLQIPIVSDDKRPGAPYLCNPAHQPANHIDPHVTWSRCVVRLPSFW
jgi:hypothetical protein